MLFNVVHGTPVSFHTPWAGLLRPFYGLRIPCSRTPHVPYANRLVFFPTVFYDAVQTEASRRASKKGAAEEKEPDEEQILAKVQRVAKANKLRETREAASVARGAAATVNDSTPSATLPVPAVYRRPPLSVAVISPLPTQWPPHQNMHDETVDAEIMAGAAAGGGVVEGGTEETVGKTESVKTSKENVGAGGKQQETGGGGGGGRAGSMMAMGIQAFLEESQKRS